jgi:hypothetical protein
LQKDFLAILDSCVVVLHIEKGQEFFVVVTVCAYPVPELQNALLVLYAVVRGICGNFKSEHQDVFVLQGVEHGSATGTDRIQKESQFPVILLNILRFYLGNAISELRPLLTVLALVKNFVFGCFKGCENANIQHVEHCIVNN